VRRGTDRDAVAIHDQLHRVGRAEACAAETGIGGAQPGCQEGEQVVALRRDRRRESGEATLIRRDEGGCAGDVPGVPPADRSGAVNGAMDRWHPSPVSRHEVARPAAVSGYRGTTISQLRLALGGWARVLAGAGGRYRSCRRVGELGLRGTAGKSQHHAEGQTERHRYAERHDEPRVHYCPGRYMPDGFISS
jgi:hypothetical protein